MRSTITPGGRAVDKHTDRGAWERRAEEEIIAAVVRGLIRKWQLASRLAMVRFPTKRTPRRNHG